ncbi:hypothetical protein ACQEWB_39305 [Streptomyces sp. CA-249302]|uniref:hypothetical protein n=1 Tax=Streptomyces sp. CA-249302 TaxID=3240058 RepID=UPI003D8DC07A
MSGPAEVQLDLRAEALHGRAVRHEPGECLRVISAYRAGRTAIGMCRLAPLLAAKGLVIDDEQ